MHRLVLSRLYDAAAILPGKIDARLRRIAALVNGGLAADALAPAYKIPQAGFREGSSIFFLSARYGNIDGGAGVAAVLPAVPVDSFLLWAELRAAVDPLLIPGQVIADLAVGTWPGLFETFPQVPTAKGGRLDVVAGEVRTSTWDFRDAPKPVAAGRQAWVTQVGAFASPRGVLSAMFKAAHQT